MRRYFTDFGKAIKNGDVWTRLSLIVMGAGYFGRKQIVKGILMTLIELGFITNPYDATLMAESPQLFAAGVANGVLAYLGML